MYKGGKYLSGGYGGTYLFFFRVRLKRHFTSSNRKVVWLNLINNTVQVFFKEKKSSVRLIWQNFPSQFSSFGQNCFSDDLSQTQLFFSHFGFFRPFLAIFTPFFDQGDTFSERLVVPDNSFSTQIAMRGV